MKYYSGQSKDVPLGKEDKLFPNRERRFRKLLCFGLIFGEELLRSFVSSSLVPLSEIISTVASDITEFSPTAHSGDAAQKHLLCQYA